MALGSMPDAVVGFFHGLAEPAGRRWLSVNQAPQRLGYGLYGDLTGQFSSGIPANPICHGQERAMLTKVLAQGVWEGGIVPDRKDFLGQIDDHKMIFVMRTSQARI
jgi:hypothetical protein